MRHFLIWFYLLLLSSLQAQDWYRGAFLILDQAGEVEVLDHLGAMDVASPESMVRPGNAAIDAAAGGELLILNSNKVVMAFGGAGKLSYERFEQVRTMQQPSWPFEYSIVGLVSTDEMRPEDNDNDDSETETETETETKVFILEGTQLCYGSRSAWDQY